MRHAWLSPGASIGAIGVFLLIVPGSAQSNWSAPPIPVRGAAPQQFAQAQSGQPAAQAPASAQPVAKPPAKAKTPAKASQTLAGAKPAAKHKLGAKTKPAVKMKVAHAPRDIVAAIYKVEAGPKGDYAGPSAFDDGRLRRLYFSKGLNAAIAALLAKSGNAPVLNFDPITNSEAPDIRNLAIAVESEKPDRVVVAAKFASADGSSIVYYDFIKEGGAWKIDNIRGEILGQNGQWSLREILKNGAQRS